MGCSQSITTDAAQGGKELPKDKRTSSPSSLQIGDRLETECQPRIARREYNSWKHQVDLTDLHLIENGKSLPVNQFVHSAMSADMSKTLSDYLDSPGKLADTIKERRLKLEEIAAESESMNASTTDLSKSTNLMNLDASKSTTTEFAHGAYLEVSKSSETNSTRQGQNVIVGL